MENFASVSKRVGWEKTTVAFPTATEVETAVAGKDLESLLRWNRFLPVAETPGQQHVIQKIVSGLTIVKLDRA